jgi:DNA-binding response OmpR family regulator
MEPDIPSDTTAAPRVLVVDDEPYIRTTVREVMRDQGYEVTEASSSEECLEILATRPMDVVLLDIKLPGMDGMEAFRRICRENYRVDVIMISGHGTIETAVEAMRQGAYDFLEKPFTLAKLRNVVKSVLDRRRQERSLEHTGEKDRLIGKYRIVGKISAGGTATVYRAVQTDLDRTVALKVLHSHLTGTDEFHERFFREAKITASLSHPGIVQIFDYGRDGASHFLAMEYIEGSSLDRHISAKRPLPMEVGLFIMADVCRALAHAHDRGVVHRDLKPQNILLSREGRVKLADFGMARLLDGSLQQLTAPNHIAGTPQFLSPEQTRGGEAGPASDIFSLGTMLYLLSTGHLPFAGPNIAAVIYQISQCSYEEPLRRNPRLDARLARAIAACLQKDPAGRFAHVEEARREIVACIGEKDRLNREAIMTKYFGAK